MMQGGRNEAGRNETERLVPDLFLLFLKSLRRGENKWSAA